MNVAQALGGAGGFSAPSMDPFEVLKADYDPNAPVKAAPPPAQIRPFVAATDLKIVRYLVGAAEMEPSTLANQAALFKPLVLLLWAGLTHLLVVYVGRGWPTAVQNLYLTTKIATPSNPGLLQTATEWLSLTPLIVVAPIVLLALFEMRHRSMFEDRMARAIGEEDMRELEEYYQVKEEGAKGGFWVLEYDGRIIGAVGLDARKPGQELDSTVDMVKPVVGDKKLEDVPAEAEATSASATAAATSPYPLRSRTKQATESTPTKSIVAPSNSITPSTTPALPADTLHLRRFASSLSFRPADIEDDLLSFAAGHAFAHSDVKYIVVTARPSVEKSLARRLKKNGWTLLPKGDAREVGKNEGEQGLVGAIWPLDLGARTFVLTREQWESLAKGQ